MATLGYVRSTNGPDLAQVGVNGQLVSHVFPNSSGETIRIESISAWVGHWGPNPAVIRFGIWAASSSSAAPGALLARTFEYTTEVRYADGAGGKQVTLYLEMPIDVVPGQVIALGVGSRGNQAGIAMFQASAISQPNESFYRRAISGTNLIAAGGEVSNQGQLAIYATGTTNVAPSAPDAWSPVGTVKEGDSPIFRVRHNDPDGDASSRVNVVVEQSAGQILRWDMTRDISVPNGTTINNGYTGAVLWYYTPYRWRARTWDIDGVAGPFSSWVNFTLAHDNRRPNLPGVPVRSGGATNRQPTFTAPFSDPDETLSTGQEYDYIAASRHIIRWGGQDRWDQTFTSTQDERDNRRSQRQIGVVVPLNTTVRYSVQHRDRDGLWSDVRSIEFVVNSGPSVEDVTKPSGRVTDLANPGSVEATYRNSAGLAANAVQVQLRTSSGAIIKASPYIAKAISNNTVFGLTWAETALGTLDPGTEYHITLQARDTSGEWSQVSNPTIITTNAQPNTPVPHSPTSGFVSSVLHYLQVTATDPDAVDEELTVTARLYTDADVLIGTVPMTPHPTAANRYQVVPSSLIAGYQTFKWQSQSSDGFLASAWSPLRTYVYAAVPAVTVTSPVGPVITTSQPTFEWVSTDQTAWRIIGRDDTGGTVYDTGVQSGGAQNYSIGGSQYWLGGERWNNHETFTFDVMVQDSTTLWGTSEPLALTLEYIPPTTLIIDGLAESFPGVKGTHFNRMWVQPTEYSQEDFVAYRWTRVDLTGPEGAEITGTSRHLLDEINSGETVLDDFDTISNQWYRYTVIQRIKSGVDIIDSDPVSIELMSSWHGTLLHMPFDPLNNYVWLRYGAPGGSYEPVRRREAPNRSVMPMNNAKPYAYRGREHRLDVSGEYTFIPTDGVTAIDQLDTLDRMFDNQYAHLSPDGRPHDMCWREGRGGRRGLLYVELRSFKDRPTIGRTQTVSLEFVEVFHVTGVEVSQ